MNKDFVYVYLEYSKLTGKKLSRHNIYTIISKWNGYLYSVLLSMLTYYDFTDPFIKEFFVDNLINNNLGKVLLSEKELVKSSVIVSPQGLMTLWKFMLIHIRRFEETDYVDINSTMMSILLLTTAVQDYLVSESLLNSNTMNYMLRNMHFNAKPNIKNAIARLYMIFFDEEINNYLRESSEYVDYVFIFNEKYGYTIEEYLAVIIGIYTFYGTKGKSFDKPWLLDLDQYFKNTKLSQIAKDVVKEMSFTWDTGEKWAKESYKKSWDFRLFKEKPLIEIVQNKYIPVSKDFLELHLLDSLFYKIRLCFDKDDNSFNTYFGRPLEKYVQWLTEKALSLSTISYFYIPEFVYSINRNRKRSPELMIRYGKKVIVVEVKKKRLIYKGFSGEDDAMIERSFEDTVVNPIKQEMTRVQEIIANNIKGLFSKEDEFYFIAITLETFPVLFQKYKDKVNELKKDFVDVNVKGFYHIDIEEYEYICELISANNELNVFDLLDEKESTYPIDSFKNYLFKTQRFTETRNILKDKFDAIFNLAVKVVKENSTTSGEKEKLV